MPGSVYEEAYLEVDGEVAGEMSIKKKKKKKKKKVRNGLVRNGLNRTEGGRTK